MLEAQEKLFEAIELLKVVAKKDAENGELFRRTSVASLEIFAGVSSMSRDRTIEDWIGLLQGEKS